MLSKLLVTGGVLATIALVAGVAQVDLPTTVHVANPVQPEYQNLLTAIAWAGRVVIVLVTVIGAMVLWYFKKFIGIAEATALDVAVMKPQSACIPEIKTDLSEMKPLVRTIPDLHGKVDALNRELSYLKGRSDNPETKH